MRTDAPAHRTPSQNSPFQPEYRRALRNADPEKWGPPSYRDVEAERVAGRLSKRPKPPKPGQNRRTS